MVRIKWIITDVMEGVNLKEFNTEWNGIYGYFEICINNRVLGFCPDRELLAEEEGNEDILYWLSKLADGIIQLNLGQKYEIQLLSMNLAKIIFKRNDKLLISCINSITNEIIWEEKIMYTELYNEVMLNFEKFIVEIQRINPILLKAKLIQSVVDIKKIIDFEIL